jgi:Rho termination factor, N-terminal domain
MLTVSKLRKYAKQLGVVNYSLMIKDELINAISNVEGQQYIVKGKCTRCSGQGYIKHYAHVEEGICFKCNGSGVEWFDREEIEYIKQQKQQNKKYEVVYHLDENSENGYIRKLFETEKEANEYYYSLIDRLGREEAKAFRRIQEQEVKYDRDGHRHILETYLAYYKKRLQYVNETIEDMWDVMTDKAKEKYNNMKNKYTNIVNNINKELSEL